MVIGDEDTRTSLWIALGNQPGVSAWYAVWLLSRLYPAAAKAPRKSAPVAMPAAKQTRRVRAGTDTYQEQARP